MFLKMYEISQVMETKNKQNAGIREILTRYLPEDGLQTCNLGPASESPDRLELTSSASDRFVAAVVGSDGLGPASNTSENIGPAPITSDQPQTVSVRTYIGTKTTEASIATGNKYSNETQAKQLRSQVSFRTQSRL
jgi:hypothetical protein